MKRIACFAAVLLLTMYTPMANAGRAQALLLAGACALCLTGSGCEAPKTQDQKRRDAVVALKAEKAKDKPAIESYQLALRQFASASGLVKNTVDGKNAVTHASDGFFVGISFSTQNGNPIASASYYDALTVEERARLEIELDDLTEFFVDRFAQQELRWADATYLANNYRYSVKLPPVLVVFTKGGKGSSRRDATAEELEQLARKFAAQATWVEVPKFQISVVTLDVRDLEERTSPRRWRQLLSGAFPGEF